MKLISGFGWYIWQIAQSGSPETIAALAHANHCEHLLIKIADGRYPYNAVDGDPAKQLAQKTQAFGMDAWGWQYVYLSNPVDEALMAIKRIKETGVTGFVVDAEAEWMSNAANAEIYMKKLRSGVGNEFPLALSSYRYPSVQPAFPWSTARKYVNLDMPQVYWVQAHNPGYQLTKSYQEFAKMNPILPYLPTGAAYTWKDWRPTVEDVDHFIQAADGIGLSGYNFWSWQNCMQDVQDVWGFLMPNKIGEKPMPDYVYKNITDSLNIRKSVWGTVVGKITDNNIAYKVLQQALDSDGKTWYRIGKERWIAGWLVRQLQPGEVP